jgi:hypothetical protein
VRSGPLQRIALGSSNPLALILALSRKRERGYSEEGGHDWKCYANRMSQISVPVSYGELIDKITILEIKSERIKNAAKLANVRIELDLLNATWQAAAVGQIDVAAARAALRRVNEALWDIEDRIRLKEKAKAFDAEFVELARSVYIRNDERAEIKRAINEKLGSTLVEEKSYEDYGAPAKAR